MGMGLFSRVIRGVAAGLLACLAACGEDGDDPLMVGTNIWPGYEPFYLAEARGLISPDDVRLVQMSSTSEVIRAFRNQVIPVAAVTLDEALLMVSEGLPIKVVLAIDTSAGGDVILAKPPLSRMEDLRGHRVGVEAGALGAFMLCRAAELHNLDCKRDLVSVDLEVNEHETAFRKGVVDAVVTFEPVRSRLLAEGALPLFDSREIPNEIVDVLVVRADIAERRRGQLKKLLTGWFGALAYMRAEPMAAAMIMARREDLSGEQFLAALAGLHIPDRAENLTLLGGGQPVLGQTAPALIKIMVQHGLLPSPLDLTGILAPQLIESLPP